MMICAKDKKGRLQKTALLLWALGCLSLCYLFTVKGTEARSPSFVLRRSIYCPAAT